MAFDVRLIAEDDRTGNLYKVVGDERGNLAFLEIDPTEVRKCDQRFKFGPTEFLVGISYGKKVLYPQGECCVDVGAPS